MKLLITLSVAMGMLALLNPICMLVIPWDNHPVYCKHHSCHVVPVRNSCLFNAHFYAIQGNHLRNTSPFTLATPEGCLPVLPDPDIKHRLHYQPASENNRQCHPWHIYSPVTIYANEIFFFKPSVQFSNLVPGNLVFLVNKNSYNRNCEIHLYPAEKHFVLNSAEITAVNDHPYKYKS